MLVVHRPRLRCRSGCPWYNFHDDRQCSQQAVFDFVTRVESICQWFRHTGFPVVSAERVHWGRGMGHRHRRGEETFFLCLCFLAKTGLCCGPVEKKRLPCPFRARPAGAQSNFSKLGSQRQRPIKSPTRVKRGREVRVEFVGMTPKLFVFNHHFSVVWFRSTVLKINHRDPPTGTQLC